MNLNKAFILGNLTRDPENRALPNGRSVTNFGIATNRFYTDGSGEKKQDAEFHNVVAFGKLAAKGSLTLIEGRLKTRSWQDTAGVKHFRTEIIAENIQLAPKTMGKMVPNTKEEIKEDIPVIEENYASPSKDSNKETEDDPQPSTESSKEKKASDDKDQNDEEIDVSSIPF